ncbi:MAG: hypothetical protein KDB03_00900 [Planctomycetales bacterium]|nr:hypothetical protein [Planctomycetales bacterium]
MSYLRSQAFLLRTLIVGAAYTVLLLGCKEPSQPSNANANLSDSESQAASVQSEQDSAQLTLESQVSPENIDEHGNIVLHGKEHVAANSNQPSPNEISPTTSNAISTVASNKNINKEAAPTSVGNLATFDELNQRIAEDWPQPAAVIFVTGQQHGYLEPCGCTGLDRQKGGLIRRDTLISQLRNRGWNVIPCDVGNQVRRSMRQAEIKFHTTVEAFSKMGYEAAALGVDDLLLSSIELVQTASSDAQNTKPFISTNVAVLDASFFPEYKIVEVGGRKIGITSALGAGMKNKLQSSDLIFQDPVEKLTEVSTKLQSEGCTTLILLAHASLEESRELAQKVPKFDLVVTAGGFGEPTYEMEQIENSPSKMVQVGTKGMFAGIVGLFDDPTTPMRYQRIAISSQFEDSARMLQVFAEYQERLKNEGPEALGAAPSSLHPSGRKFVGSESCAECHTSAFEVWEGTTHAHATESIIHPSNDRGAIERHHDPECISCHVTGWNVEFYYPYVSAWTGPDVTPMLSGSGCENCHGPGANHVAAENGEIDIENSQLLELREQMKLPLAKADEKCRTCHDLDNSPEFNFETYWEQVKHSGKD